MGILFSFLVGIALGVGIFSYSIAPGLPAPEKKVLNKETGKELKPISNISLGSINENDIPNLTPETVPFQTESPASTPTDLPLITFTVTPTKKPTATITRKLTITPTVSHEAIPTITSPEAFSPTVLPSPPAAPTIIPTIKPIAAPPQFEGFFNQYAVQYNVDVNLLKKIAKCESGFNNNANGTGGQYIGMFQFNATTWINLRSLMGMDPNPDLRYGGQESIQTAAYAVSLGRQNSLWPSCI